MSSTPPRSDAQARRKKWPNWWRSWLRMTRVLLQVRFSGLTAEGNSPSRSRGSRIEDRESRIEDRGSRIENRESRIENRGSRIEDRGSRIENRGSRTEACHDTNLCGLREPISSSRSDGLIL